MIAYYPNVVARLLQEGTKGGTMAGSKLTDEDRALTAQADEVAGLRGLAALRDHTGEALVIEALVSVLAEAQHLLAAQNAIIRRLDSSEEGGGNEPGTA